MEVKYRKLFLEDLKKLKGHIIYNHAFDFAFKLLPKANSLKDIANVKAMKGYANRYRVRMGNYRIG